MQTSVHRIVSTWTASTIALMLAGCGANSDHSGVSSDSGGSSAAAGRGIGGSAKGGAGGAPVGSDTGGNVAQGGAGTRGGAGGAAGKSGGTGGSHVVTECALSDVGVWDSVTPPQVSLNTVGVFNTGVNAFVLDPHDSATIYLGTCAQGIYKSTDCGATWVHVNTGTNGPALDGGRNWAMQIDPVDSSLFVNAGYGIPGLWKSTNGGVAWTNLIEPGSDFDKVSGSFVEFIALDPADHEHLLVSAHTFCTADGSGGGSCFANSTDGGATWTVIPATSDMYFEGLTQTIIDAHTWLVFTNGIFLTTDAGKSWTKTPIPATTTTGEIYRSDDGTYYLPAGYGLVKSRDRLTWTQNRSAPNSMSLAGDGKTMFTSYPTDSVPYYTSTGDGSAWTAYPGPSPSVTRASWLMRYDRDHNLLYTSNESGGFWRVRTK